MPGMDHMNTMEKSNVKTYMVVHVLRRKIKWYEIIAMLMIPASTREKKLSKYVIMSERLKHCDRSFSYIHLKPFKTSLPAAMYQQFHLIILTIDETCLLLSFA